jgi:hypothetical protein
VKEALLRRLASVLAHVPVRVPAEGDTLAIFPARHPEVGDVTVAANGEELVVMLGRFTHVHFASQDRALPPAARTEQVVSEAADFLEQLFADRIEFYGGPRGGGWRPRTGSKRGGLSRWFFGRKTYVWSGPLA